MNNEKKGLNLPAISKSGDLSKVNSKRIQSLDLYKKSSVNSILKTNSSSVQNNILKMEHGLDLVLVGDLTYSMTAYHELLKNKFVELSCQLFPLIKNLRIGLVFYLDHDDSGSTGCDNAYITRVHKLTTNTEELIQFINSTSTGNG